MEPYRDALRILAHSTPAAFRQLFVKHHRAPDHTVTARELSQAVGYADYSAVTLHCGSFAAEIASA